MSWTRARAQLAVHHRYHPEADDGALRRNLRAARAEDYIRALVASAPPLTEEQRDRLSLLLHGGEAA